MTFSRNVFLLVVCLLALLSVRPLMVHAIGAVVPAYIPMWNDRGMDAWQRLLKGAEELNGEMIIILNMNNGPMPRSYPWFPQYEELAMKFHAKGALLVGYVATIWGAREQANVDEEIHQWFATMPYLDGIFFDEASYKVSELDWYLDRANYVRSHRGDALVILNPGMAAEQTVRYLEVGAADIVVILEHFSQVITTWKPPSWVDKWGNQTAIVIHDAQRWEAVYEKALQNSIGWVYATDGEWSDVHPEFDQMMIFTNLVNAGLSEQNSKKESSPSKEGKRNQLLLALGIGLGVPLFVAGLSAGYLAYRRKKLRGEEEADDADQRIFSPRELTEAIPPRTTLQTMLLNLRGSPNTTTSPETPERERLKPEVSHARRQLGIDSPQPREVAPAKRGRSKGKMGQYSRTPLSDSPLPSRRGEGQETARPVSVRQIDFSGEYVDEVPSDPEVLPIGTAAKS